MGKIQKGNYNLIIVVENKLIQKLVKILIQL